MAPSLGLQAAFDAYTTHRASLGQASVIAGLPMTTFLEEARRHGVLPVYGTQAWCGEA